MDTVLTNVRLFAPLVVGYIMAEFTGFLTISSKYDALFRFAALLMGGTLMVFLFGSRLISHEELLDESNLHKIFRICKSAFGKRRSKYPTSVNGYYCKEYKQNHVYDHDKRLRLTPRVPRLFRWLDKAAIVEPEDSTDPNEMNLEMLKKNGKLCTVKEVKEVKSLVPMICMCFSFFAYSVLMATGNTFFVAQAIQMNITGGNYIARLFLIKAVVRNISQFICFFAGFIVCDTKGTDFMSKRKVATVVRIGFGMVCGVVCSFIAWKVEAHRLSLPLLKENTDNERGRTSSLVPQFILLGMSEGLVEGGLESLFCGHVVKSMWGFKDSFTELVIGTGKLFLIPVILIFRRWINENSNDSHLDKFYLMLGILNVMFLMGTP
ncbi:hypothetical protein VNO78_25987 [Psophocarpus tetragonolobus]|uniref:Uncharacterized protein n=1 Tax=Psophocarpus tetragonolobus TaxID=3891 RepID=A0AAN9XFW5_PSOTE